MEASDTMSRWFLILVGIRVTLESLKTIYTIVQATPQTSKIRNFHTSNLMAVFRTIAKNTQKGTANLDVPSEDEGGEVDGHPRHAE